MQFAIRRKLINYASEVSRNLSKITSDCKCYDCLIFELPQFWKLDNLRFRRWICMPFYLNIFHVFPCNKQSLIMSILSLDGLSFCGLAWTFEISAKQVHRDQHDACQDFRHYVLEVIIRSLRTLKFKSLCKILGVAMFSSLQGLRTYRISPSS